MDFDYNVEKQELTVELNSPSITLDTPTGGKGLKGDKGNKGDKGDTGTAATISVGATTTGAAGSSAAVTNVGTSSAAVLNFTIPKGDTGDKGDTGATGQDGVSPTVSTSKVGKTTTVTFTDVNGTSTATILDGADASEEWGAITGTLSDQTDLKNALDDKADVSSLSTVATSGSYNDLSNKPTIKESTWNSSSYNLSYHSTTPVYTVSDLNTDTYLIPMEEGIRINKNTANIPSDVVTLIGNDYGFAVLKTYSTDRDKWQYTGIRQELYLPRVTNRVWYRNITGTSNGATYGNWQEMVISSDLSSKQDTLVSGTNIKTINSQSLLGSGDITVAGASAWGDLTGDINDQTDLKNALDAKAEKSLYGDTTINVGRKASTTVGSHSTALGEDTEASGYRSYAEGQGTKSTGYESHAEGLNTTASGQDAHAEGQNTVASGANSHAEGLTTTAGGKAAHAEGYYTKASSEYQHVSGKYNIEDSNGTYAEIIGNGTANNSRSNARTLDWSGNEVLAGSLTINGNQTVTTTGDFKTINNESIIGSGNIDIVVETLTNDEVYDAVVKTYDILELKDMSHLYEYSSIETIDISNKYDTNNTTDMSYMFNWCSWTKAIDAGYFQTQNVTNMEYMFNGCNSLETLYIVFDTSNVTNMDYMFANCSVLPELYINTFDFSNVTSHEGIFAGCGASLDNPTTVYVADQAAQDWILNLSNSDRPANWTTSNVIIGGVS